MIDFRSVANTIKSQVSLQEVVVAYGYTPNRAGFIRCPFHQEKSPSAKIYPESFHCFGCGAHGDAIDFVSKLFNLEPLAAAKRIDEDFRLGLDLSPGRPPDRQELARREQLERTWQAFVRWRDETLLELNAAIRVANRADFSRLTDAEAVALVWREVLEAWADCLQHGSMADQLKVFLNREEVSNVCKRVLKKSRTQSPAA